MDNRRRLSLQYRIVNHSPLKRSQHAKDEIVTYCKDLYSQEAVSKPF